MDIKITADYTQETGEILVCTHESTGGTMSLIFGDVVVRVTALQARGAMNKIDDGLKVVDAYAKMVKRNGAGGNVT